MNKNSMVPHRERTGFPGAGVGGARGSVRLPTTTTTRKKWPILSRAGAVVESF